MQLQSKCYAEMFYMVIVSFCDLALYITQKQKTEVQVLESL